MPPIAILVALADPTRCKIIEILRDGPRPVHVVASAFKISRPAISRHLRVLKQARLISEKKVGRENLYQLHPKRLEPVQKWLAEQMPLAKPAPPPIIAEAAQEAAPAPVAPEPVSVLVPKPKKSVAKRTKVVPPVSLPPEAPDASPASQMGFDF
jgi:DNA-binding transcriptional ArsR family regulator